MRERIEIIQVGEDRQAPIDQFLGYLENGLFATPESGQWREHDELFHIPRINTLSVDEVQFVMDAAQLARRLLHEGRKIPAVYAAESIDRFLTDVVSSQIFERQELEKKMIQYGVQERLF